MSDGESVLPALPRYPVRVPISDARVLRVDEFDYGNAIVQIKRGHGGEALEVVVRVRSQECRRLRTPPKQPTP